LLMEAVKIKPNEPVYKDELAINMSVLATALAAQKDTTTANQFANDAIALNGEVVTAHPNNVVYWKNRVRLFYTLAQVSGADQQLIYYQEALKAIQKASEIAPTDAKIAYNLGVLYGQTGDIPKGIEVLEQTIKMKPNYRDPYYALGLFYYQLSLDQNNKVIRPELKEKAVAIFNYILTNLNPADEEVKKTLKTWDE
jgi:tetratricopeptide (TPR) repeat protein